MLTISNIFSEQMFGGDSGGESSHIYQDTQLDVTREQQQSDIDGTDQTYDDARHNAIRRQQQEETNRKQDGGDAGIMEDTYDDVVIPSLNLDFTTGHEIEKPQPEKARFVETKPEKQAAKVYFLV